jgi:hypothetical protein
MEVSVIVNYVFSFIYAYSDIINVQKSNNDYKYGTKAVVL